MKPHFVECPYPETIRGDVRHKNNLVNLNQVAMISKIHHSSYAIGFANSNGDYFHQWIYSSDKERDEDYQRILSFL